MICILIYHTLLFSISVFFNSKDFDLKIKQNQQETGPNTRELRQLKRTTRKQTMKWITGELKQHQSTRHAIKQPTCETTSKNNNQLKNNTRGAKKPLKWWSGFETVI